jgi:hypothetical protein
VQENVKAAKKEYDRTEDDLKALQSVGQIIGEVLRQLDSERCMSLPEDSTHPPFLLNQYLEKSATKICYCQNRALLGFHNFVIAGFRKWPEPDTRVLHSTELCIYEELGFIA